MPHWTGVCNPGSASPKITINFYLLSCAGTIGPGIFLWKFTSFATLSTVLLTG